MESVLEDAFDFSLEWASVHGLTKLENFKDDCAIKVQKPISFTLLPSVFPEAYIKNLLETQPIINDLIYKMSRDQDFVASTIEQILDVDEFSKNLYDIYKAVNSQKTNQSISLSIVRSDYFPVRQSPSEDYSAKMVEYNCISVSFVGLVPLITNLQKIIIEKYLGYESSARKIPRNGHFFEVDTLKEACDGIALAHSLYGDPNAAVLFVVEEEEKNIYDQILVKNYLLEKFCIPLDYAKPKRHNIRSLKGSLFHLSNRLIVERRPSNNLYINNRHVSVVYFRSAYSIESYPDQKCWDTRRLIEMSNAIKCPDIGTHIVGMKKFQEKLYEPGVLEKFISNPKHVKLLRDTFVGFHSLAKPEDSVKNLNAMKKSPEKYVLKPQREGGGHNIYGSQILDFLKNMKDKNSLKSYILMDLIDPVKEINYFASDKGLSSNESVTEIGVYGTYLRDSDIVYLNNSSGILLRTKDKDVNEGGVCSGHASLSSLYIST